MTRAHVTHSAGAAEAAGTRTETVDVPQSIDAAELRACLAVGKSAHFADLVGVCALIIDGQTISEAERCQLGDNIQIEVLPPFAGG